MRRHLWRGAIGLAIVIVALAVFAWPQGDDDGGGPLNAIAEAAEKTQGEPGGRATMKVVVSSPERSAPLAVTGQGAYDAEGRTRMVVTVPRSAADGPMKLEAVGDGTMLYMRSSQFGELPDGSEWMGLDLAFGEMETPLPASVDAKGELALLEATGEVRKLGKEDVRGVQTTFYRGTVGVSETAERMREQGADDLAAVYEEEGSPVQVETWIDADELVRRMRIVQTKPAGSEGSETIDMRVDFYDFGLDPEIEVPESDEVFDATSLAREEAGLSDDE